jgi:predicted RND superfamily exporter protein/CRP-like cAMP-binding protein
MDLEATLQRFGLSDDQVLDFKGFFSRRHYEPGDTVFTEGDAADTFYVIHSGELLVTQRTTHGGERTLSVRRPGEVFGEIGLLEDTPRIASVTALTHVQLFEIGERHFCELIEANASFHQFLKRLHAHRLLSSIPLFQGLGDKALEKIQMLVEPRDVRAGDVLAEEGGIADRLFVILEGAARGYRSGLDVAETEKDSLGHGDHLGAEGLLAISRHGRSVAMETDGRVAVLGKQDFVRLVRRTPSIAMNLSGLSVLKLVLPLFFDKSAFFYMPSLAMNRPRMFMYITLLTTVLLLVPAIVPNLLPGVFPFLSPLKIDTNPENMLSADEPVRQYHKQMRKEMDLHDMIVVGVVNEAHPNGVFNPDSLQRVYALTEFIKTLQWPDEDDPSKTVGIVQVDILAPSTVDVIEQGAPGTVDFSWLMRAPPTTQEEATAVFETMQRFPLMERIMVSGDGRALALYLPITSKEVSYRIYKALRERIAEMTGDEHYFITGLPVAEETFGVEMFIQMAISAPMAMIVVFALLLFFFRNLTLVGAPMIVAMVSVICTVALLVVTGNTVHIMSSMIPIFIMPIAVLDSVHILSEFFDFYPRIRDLRLTMNHAMRELFIPMFFTSITTAVGFASLALVPIPPVQVFGIFVAVGVLLAWLLSVTFIPAYIALLSDNTRSRLAEAADRAAARKSLVRDGLLERTRRLTMRYPRRILLVSFALVAACVVGIIRIEVNDNPVRWFAPDHPIRVADRVLNEHLAGTYMAYLTLESEVQNDVPDVARAGVNNHLAELAAEFPARGELIGQVREQAQTMPAGSNLVAGLQRFAEFRLDAASDRQYAFWDALLVRLDELAQVEQVFKDPAVLNYVAELQAALVETGIVGKAVSVADFSKTVNRELRGGVAEDYRVPATAQGVAQTLLTYQSSHRPQDLWHSVTPDFRKGVLWLMLNSGDNRDMTAVVDAANDFMTANPPPVELTANWFGLTYINVIWQEKMVTGMLGSIAGSFLTVLLLMIILLRSTAWGLLAMVPLSATMLVIYGVLGLAGKSYDMPVAVLSSLSIGLAVDFTIHFLVRIRHFMSQTRSPLRSHDLAFGQPAVAISRNVLVVAIGFLPLLFAPLVPYQTVGTLIATILCASGMATLLIVPACLRVWEGHFFPATDSRRTTLFGTGNAVVVGVLAAVLVGVNIQAHFGETERIVMWILLMTGLPGAVVLATRGADRAVGGAKRAA